MPNQLVPGKRVSQPTRASTAPDRTGKSFVRGGSTIHYWDRGDRHAPAVVLTHGVTVDHGTFMYQTPVLLEAGYRVITWDLRGHGASQPMGQRFTVRGAAEDLAALLDDAGVARAVLVGQSFGGAIIQELYRLRPQRVSGMVLVGAMPLGERLPWHQALLQRARPFLLRIWPEGNLRRVTPSFLSRDPGVQEYLARALAPLTKADLIAVTEGALQALLDSEPVGRVTVPVLLVRGEDEMAMVSALMDRWVARDPSVRMEVIEGAGHLANQERPDRFNDALLRFLSGHSVSS